MIVGLTRVRVGHRMARRRSSLVFCLLVFVGGLVAGYQAKKPVKTILPTLRAVSVPYMAQAAP